MRKVMRVCRITGWAMAGAAGLISAGYADDCPCRKNQATGISGPSHSIPVQRVSSQVWHGDGSMIGPAPMMGPGPIMGPAQMMSAPTLLPAPGMMAAPTMIGQGSTTINAGVGENRFGVMPPPGTLGRTYQQRSTLNDQLDHPRTGHVDVFLPEDVDVTARGMKSKWLGDRWRLQTTEPLVPGVPHIYAIKAERRSPSGHVTSTDVRWVRLIMGRVVDLRF
jgi:hypothetical protein